MVEGGEGRGIEPRGDKEIRGCRSRGDMKPGGG